MLDLPIRSHPSPPLQASKWLKCPSLIDVEEMRGLLNHLGSFRIYLVSGIWPKGQVELSHDQFLTHYEVYIAALKRGEYPDEKRLRPYLSCVWTYTPDPLYALEVAGGDQLLVKVERPVVQLQLHRFAYSPSDGTFHSMVWGESSILWGLQWSYPQLYQDPHYRIQKVVEGEAFPNTSLFKALQRWMRSHTVATPFEVFEIGSKVVNVPIRLGKNCFEWIHLHPQLQEKGLRVPCRSTLPSGS